MFSSQLFFTDHLKYKTINKTTDRVPSENLRRLQPEQLDSFPIIMIIILNFQDFFIYLAKYFWSILNSANLIFLSRAMQIK